MYLPTIRALIISFCVSQVSATQEDPHPNTLLGISYNTWYVFNHKKETKAGKEWLRSQTPDIVALQELTPIKPELLQSFAESWIPPRRVRWC